MATRGARIALLLVVVAAGGCGPLRLPELPRPIRVPDATVQRVERVELTEQGATYRVHLNMDNTNDDALPLTMATYTLAINGVRYRTDTVPDATLPARRSLTVILPGVIADGLEAGAAYEVTGWMRLDPPGELKQVLYGLGWPRPQIMFYSRGTID